VTFLRLSDFSTYNNKEDEDSLSQIHKCFFYTYSNSNIMTSLKFIHSYKSINVFFIHIQIQTL